MRSFLRSSASLVSAVASIAALALPVAQASAQTTAPAAQRPAAASKPAAALPAARKIIDRYVAAIGGREAIMKHSSSHMRGTFEMPAAGMRGDVVGKSAKPDKMVMSITFPGLGEIRSGFDGTTAWSIEPTSGPRVLDGAELAQARQQADFLAALHEEKNYTSMETVELTEFEGKKAYMLRLVRAGTDTSYEYFDAESGLLVGVRATRDTQMGPMTATTALSNYRDFGGVQLPTLITTRAAGQEIVMTLTSLEWDTVEPAAFELPPEIKVLVGK